MNNRAIAKLLPPMLIFGGIMWVIEKYGKFILLAFVLIFVFFILWLIFGLQPSSNIDIEIKKKNCQRHLYSETINPNLEWDLYIAIKRNKLSEAKRLIRAGADPFSPFKPSSRPSSTDAINCYEFVKKSPNREKFISLFEKHQRV